MENDSYASVAARLASFEAAIPIPTKKRVSTAKAAKSIAWPHKTPSPTELAQAGFYFQPTAHSHDNAVCFLCERALDGWESDDDPLEEHMKHSSDCAWATLMNINRESHDPSTMENPTDDHIAGARRATFASGWPHESKRGWVCKTEKMVEAGWHFAPTPESEDFVSCAYCKLSLDGWEPKDNPFDEHHRRSPDCLFFVFAGTTAPKAGRARKARTSKASRMSTQSNLPIETETQSIPDLDESIDTSTLSVMSTMSTAGKKKNARGKKKATKALAAAPKSTIDLDSSVVEIPAPTQPAKAPRGQKRTSDHISEDDQRDRESTVRPEPPAKRRNTRTRESIIEDSEPSNAQTSSAHMDVTMTPMKPAKKGRKRASSTTRKVSTASTAALRSGVPNGVPDDATIDAALEADFNRPLSDEEENVVAEQEKPKRGRSKKVTASTAPTRGRKVEAPEDVQVEPEKALDETDQQETNVTAYETDAESKPKGRKPRATKKLAAKNTAHSNRTSLASNVTLEIHNEHAVEGSILTTRTLEDDSGHETDASVAGKSIARKASKRKAPGKVKGRKAATRVVSKTIETTQAESSAITALEAAIEPMPSLAAAMEADKMDLDEKIAELTKEIDEEDAAPEKSSHPAKGGKGKAAKAKAKKEKIPQLSMPGAFSPIVFESAEPSFASALSPNSPPLKSNLRQAAIAKPADRDMDMDMEIRSAEQQSTPTPKRVAPPALPPRSPARPTPTPVANKSGLSQSAATPTRSTRKSSQRQATPSPERSPDAQSSDAENAPPSSRPESVRPPLAPLSPAKRVVLAPGTPTTTRRIGVGMMSPNKIGGGLKSEAPWSAVDVELAFQQSVTPGAEKENEEWFSGSGADCLASHEKGMNVEQWIYENARRAEEELRKDGERAVGVFEREGARAMRVLEGVVCE